MIVQGDYDMLGGDTLQPFFLLGAQQKFVRFHSVDLFSQVKGLVVLSLFQIIISLIAGVFLVDSHGLSL